jgi:hypothetical protein
MDIVQAVRDLLGSPTIENEQLSPTVNVTSAGSESVGSERLGRIMGRHECLRIPSDPSHSDSTEQVNDV